jgi:hypothetical protein
MGADMTISSERTAALLIKRHGGRKAFDFAARQVALLDLADAGRSVAEWKAIAMAIERLRTQAPSVPKH